MKRASLVDRYESMPGLDWLDEQDMGMEYVELTSLRGRPL